MICGTLCQHIMMAEFSGRSAVNPLLHAIFVANFVVCSVHLSALSPAPFPHVMETTIFEPHFPFRKLHVRHQTTCVDDVLKILSLRGLKCTNRWVFARKRRPSNSAAVIVCARVNNIVCVRAKPVTISPRPSPSRVDDGATQSSLARIPHAMRRRVVCCAGPLKLCACRVCLVCAHCGVTAANQQTINNAGLLNHF